MKYYTFHIDDSGAIEDHDEKIINGRKTLICRMYDDPEFNSLNNILHSLDDYIMDDRALSLFKKSSIIPYDITPVIVKRKEKQLGFININKSYKYNLLKIHTPHDLYCYDWINFNESNITVFKGKDEIGNLSSHEQLLNLIAENHEISSYENGYSWETKTIVFNKRFDHTVDLFAIPFYSWGIYVSERFKELLVTNNITHIGFAETKEELGKVWKPHFPDIRFE